MKYMIIETFKTGKIKEVYKRFQTDGRLMPDGLIFIDSWITEDLAKCYQVMETADVDKLYEWMKEWNDLVEFEVKAVLTSRQAKEKVFSPKDRKRK